MQSTTVSITATGNQTAFTQSAADNCMTVGISGTYGTLAFTLQGSVDGTNFTNIACLDMATMQVTTGGTSISPSDNATRMFRVPSENLVAVRMVVGTLASGTVTAIGRSNRFAGGVFNSSVQTNATLTGNSAITGTETITSADASALTVGRLGATTPVLKVDASTASVVTGLQIKGAASGSGLALLLISSGTNETMNIDSKGSGNVCINDTATGILYANRGALKAIHCGLTLTALGTTQSSTPTAAQLLGGFLTQTGSTGAGAVTLPTGTALSAACPRTPATGDSFECWFNNLGGGQTLTITGATGTTVVGTATVATATSAIMRFICTGTNAWTIGVVAGL